MVENTNPVPEATDRLRTFLKDFGTLSERLNILALNAKIELAVAGKAGSGFTKIADELLVLAEGCLTMSEQISLVQDQKDELPSQVDHAPESSVQPLPDKA